MEVDPDLADDELGIAVREPPKLRSLGQYTTRGDLGRGLAASLGRKFDLERQVDRRLRQEFS